MAGLNNELVGALVDAGLLTLRLPAPGRDRMRVALPRLAFTTAVRVIDRVHDDTANRRTDSAPALRTGLAERTERVLGVADFADGRAAVDVDLANLAGTQPQLRVFAFTRQQLHRATGCARGGSITWLSWPAYPENMINYSDPGRLIQQSYYAGARLDRRALRARRACRGGMAELAPGAARGRGAERGGGTRTRGRRLRHTPWRVSLS